MKFYLLYRNDGLYEPVLDDTEPLFEPIELEDFDQPSQPTEVQCPIPDFLDINDSGNLETRSLTASPFLLLNKPYRPFSTEPIVIPPVEDPIILNPDYQDDFSKFYVDDDLLPKTKFKLPISDQYDPDGTKKRKEMETSRESMEISKEMSSCYTSKEILSSEFDSVKETQKIGINETQKISINESFELSDTQVEFNLKDQHVRLEEETKTEIYIKNIEQIASTIVNESIQKAVQVAEEIKEEIDVELRDSSLCKSDIISTEQYTESKKICKETSEVIDSKQKVDSNVKEFVKLVDNTTDQILKQNVDIGTKKVQIFETNSSDEKTEIRKNSVKQELEESIIAGSVRKHSEVFETKSEEMSGIVDVQQKKSHNEVRIKDAGHKVVVDNISIEKAEGKTAQNSQNKSKVTGNKYTTKKLLAEQRAYTIGLQTIPNIRGTLHSSYHYDLLLKTFFIHLTDVMVALSRFILAEPVLSKETEETHQELTEEMVTQEVTTTEKKETRHLQTTEQRKESDTEILQKEAIYQRSNEIQESHNETDNIQKDENLSVDIKSDHVEKVKLTGSKMAQLTEKKSEELTHKMDAVISEFQTKAGVEENISSIVQTEFIEENLQDFAQESITKTNNTFTSVTKESLMESVVECAEKKINEINVVDMDIKDCEESRNMYIAVVESHVYTNKDFMFEEQTKDLAETNRVSEEKITSSNSALESSEAVTSERVALQSYDKETNTAKQLVEKLHDVSTADISGTEILSATAQSIETQLVSKNEMTVSSTENLSLHSQVADSQHTITSKHAEATSIHNKTIYDESLKTSEIVKDDFNQNTSNVEISSEVSKVGYLATDESAALKIVKQEIQELKDTAEIKELTVNSIENLSIHSQIADSQQIIANKHSEASSFHTKAVIDECIKTEAIIEDNFEANSSNVEVFSEVNKAAILATNESGVSKIVKREIQDLKDTAELKEVHISLKQHTEIENRQSFQSTQEKNIQSLTSQQTIQEASFNNRLVQVTEKRESELKKLNITNGVLSENHFEREASQSDESSTISTPTPSTVPPTPLTDEYMFKLEIKLPKGITPIPPDPDSPIPEDHEDPNIVKKKLIPHIDTTIENRILFDPPLATPDVKTDKPFYSKPGLMGGADRAEYNQEEIREIERKSTLLASAIDQTIKSIEEYKEEVGLNKDSNLAYEAPVIYNGFAKVIETKVYDSVNSQEKEAENWVKIDKQVIKNTDIINKMTSKETKKEESFIDVMKSDKTSTEVNKSHKNSEIKLEEVAAMFTNVETQEAIAKLNAFAAKVAKASSEEVVEEPIPEPEIPVENIDLAGFRSVAFEPDKYEMEGRIRSQSAQMMVDSMMQEHMHQEKIAQAYKTDKGEVIGTQQGIVDGLDEAMVDSEVAKELGKPGMSEDKIAELISGESEMLREAHVMGLKRVLNSHMNRAPDDSSIDFKKIKPLVESLKDSEVLKALNEEMMNEVKNRKKEEAKREETKWTTFLQKPSRPVPKVRFGYYGYVDKEVEKIEEPYKVKIVKQPKPKVAPDYKSEDFNTGPLPWEERALLEPAALPVSAEDPILIPEETPEFFKAVDPTKESEVPDLEDTGIQLPPEKLETGEEVNEIQKPESEKKEDEEEEKLELIEVDLEEVVEETEKTGLDDMDNSKLAEQLMTNVQNMVDPNASLEQQLSQMRAQLAALAQLPCVIQQTLELVTKQLSNLSHQEVVQVSTETKLEQEQTEEYSETITEETAVELETISEEKQECEISKSIEEIVEDTEDIPESTEVKEVALEEMKKLKKVGEEVLEEQRRIEKQKQELIDQMKQDCESRQIKQRPTPRVGKPKPAFGPLTPSERPVVLPGGRRWRTPKDAYNEQFIAETLSAQAEIIQGKAKGLSYESVHLPYDERESNCHLVDFHRLREDFLIAYENLIEDKLQEVREAASLVGPPPELGRLQTDPRYGTVPCQARRDANTGGRRV